MKKANKGHEGQTKARESTMPKFFISTEPLGILYSQIWVFLNFKAIKAKKAALVARNTKLQTGKFVGSKILSYHLVTCFSVLFVKFGTPFSK